MQNLGPAFRALFKQPLFTAIGIGAFALGIAQVIALRAK